MNSAEANERDAITVRHIPAAIRCRMRPANSGRAGRVSPREFTPRRRRAALASPPRPNRVPTIGQLVLSAPPGSVVAGRQGVAPACASGVKMMAPGLVSEVGLEPLFRGRSGRGSEWHSPRRRRSV